MKKLIKTPLKFIYLLLLISTVISCKSPQVILQDGVYFSEMDMHQAYVDQIIKETDLQDSANLRELKALLQEVLLNQSLLANIKPKLKPSPCAPPNNCPNLINDMDHLILASKFKGVTMQILSSEGKVLSEATGKLNSSSNLKGLSVFDMSFQNKEVSGMNLLKVIKTDIKGNISTFTLPLKTNF